LHSLAMYLRRNRRRVEGEVYEYWTLVQTVRTAKGPRQEVVASLGKEPGLDSRSRHGWEGIADLLEGRAPAPVQGELGQVMPAAPGPQWAQVDLSGLRVERVRDFGQVYLALSLWRRLGLQTLLGELIEPGREEVPWELTACILTLARFCGQKSELEVAQRGVYGGVVGYFGLAGDADLAIAIRTATIVDGLARVQAGAGLVADSDPATEHQEAQNKAAAPLRAVAIANAMRRLS